MGKKFTVPMARKEFFNELISEWSIYEAVKRGEIPCCRVGRRILLDEDDLNAWWARQTAAGQNNGEVQRGVLRRVQ